MFLITFFCNKIKNANDKSYIYKIKNHIKHGKIKKNLFEVCKSPDEYISSRAQYTAASWIVQLQLFPSPIGSMRRKQGMMGLREYTTYIYLVAVLLTLDCLGWLNELSQSYIWTKCIYTCVCMCVYCTSCNTQVNKRERERERVLRIKSSPLMCALKPASLCVFASRSLSSLRHASSTRINLIRASLA